MAALPFTDRRFAAICAAIKGLLFAPAAAAEAGPTIPRGAVRAALGVETLIRLLLLDVAKEYEACWPATKEFTSKKRTVDEDSASITLYK